MRFHLLSTPNTRTTHQFELDGFCLRTILFASLLKQLGHTVILYGVESNDAPCDEFVSCLSEAERVGFLAGTPYQYATFDGSPAFLTYNTRAALHIRNRKQPGDIIATIGGSAQQQVAEHHPELRFLEYSIGYRGIVAPYRVYQSHIWRHVVHGFQGVEGGRVTDAVIPPWFPIEDFPFTTNPDPYVVFCGRLIQNKGLAVACEAAKAAGVPLKVIGHGEAKNVTYGEYLGPVSHQVRNEVLSKAIACLMPTQYIEPFGNVAAEAQLCGTPIISTEFGAFVESVEQGRTGYRCGVLGDYVHAIDLCRDLSRTYVRARAERLYSTHAALKNYATYFARMDALASPEGVHSPASTLDSDTGHLYGSPQSASRRNRPTETAIGDWHRYQPDDVPAAATA